MPIKQTSTKEHQNLPKTNRKIGRTKNQTSAKYPQTQKDTGKQEELMNKQVQKILKSAKNKQEKMGRAKMGYRKNKQVQLLK